MTPELAAPVPGVHAAGREDCWPTSPDEASDDTSLPEAHWVTHPLITPSCLHAASFLLSLLPFLFVPFFFLLFYFPSSLSQFLLPPGAGGFGGWTSPGALAQSLQVTRCSPSAVEGAPSSLLGRLLPLHSQGFILPGASHK